MARTEKKYRRLPGRASPRKFFSLTQVVSSRLFLGEDHVLFVCSSYYADSYKRFYLSDIQALVTTRTNGRRNANILYFILAAVFVANAFIFRSWEWTRSLQYPFLGISGVGVLLAAINTLLGPTCVCDLHTAVQVENLSCLRRLRTAQKTIGILKPLIEAAQGRLTADELRGQPEERERVQASAHAITEPRKPRRHEHGTIHVIAFCLLLVGATSSLTDILFQHPLKSMVGLILFLGMFIFLIIAVTKQADTDLPETVKSVTRIALCLLIISFLFGIIYGNIYRMSHPEMFQQNIWEAKIEGPIFVGYCIADAAVTSVLGLLGIAMVLRFRYQYAAYLRYSRGSTSVEHQG
jgi:hypothetical protein